MNINELYEGIAMVTTDGKPLIDVPPPNHIFLMDSLLKCKILDGCCQIYIIYGFMSLG
jgi:hypothetical protein